MAIKPTGSGIPVAPTTEIGGATKASGAPAKFDIATNALEPQQPAANNAAESAVRDVVREIRAGRLTTTEERVDAVIENMVRGQMPQGASVGEIRDRVFEAQLVLGDDPTFSVHIQTLIRRALDE